MTFSRGTVLQQRYEIVDIIGSGGFGAVYEAKDLRLGHRVALKQLTLAGGQVQRAFEREARILANLRHPALPKVSDYFFDSSGYFLVMEFISGDDFRSLLAQQNGPFPVAQVVGWLDELLDVLDYLHNQQPPVIHRDIKPANIKLAPPRIGGRGGAGEIVLLDFGISKGGRLGTIRQSLANSSIQAFSFNYSSLEQLEGRGTDARSDLYSLGITAHYLLTGSQPPTVIARADAQLRQEADPLVPANQLNPRVPAELAQLISSAASLNPNQRPSSALVMRDRLKAISFTQQANHSTAPRSIRTTEQTLAQVTSTAPAGQQLLLGVVAILLLIIIAGLATFLFRYSSSSEPNVPSTVITQPGSPAATEISTKIPPATEISTEIATSPPATATLVGSVPALPEPTNKISPANAAQVAEVARFGPFGEMRVGSVAISPDGNILASGSDDNLVRLWHLSDGTLLGTLAGHTNWVRSVAISSDGTTLASGSDDRTIRLWNLSDGSLINILEGHKNYVYSVAISPDGTTLASGSRDNTVRLWRISDGALIHTLTGHTDRVNSVTISPDGSTVASSSRDSTVRLWRISDGQLINTFTQPQNSIWSIAISPDGQTLALGADEKLQLWRISDGLQLLSLQGHNDVVWSVAFSPDGTIIASGLGDNTVRLWRVSDGTLLTRLDGHTGNVYSVAISADGTTLASGSVDGTVRLWRVVQE